ncbi:response regulator transcription factor [Methylomonas sp. MED-D]|uniref:Response regulatory domain-containing protein n=1 Tax=Methylomonas koyamae TaxID=702114 RepID=A0A177NAY3_9GAMM|nr:MULTISPECIES: response regulator transcription factor [Methylomonas]MDT4329704.1 response regulator transcription factor [Methylomonas sp. MV1]OAI14260.1 hypothetical protein A1355_00755 [Methylomonas koyamae]OHX38367.1 hypothetical protein BJL95_08665 [Methylomonas sp. LWB]WGS87120.1 response regulator transcription factor [Methylomonas sp. UP202]
MKIHVVDNTGQIPPLLLMSEEDVSFYNDEIQALNAAEAQQPSLILLSFSLRGDETPDYIGLLLNASPASKIVVIGDEIGEDRILNCLLAGSRGYQNSGPLSGYLAKMIQVVADGEAWVSRRMVGRLLDVISQNNLVLSV